MTHLGEGLSAYLDGEADEWEATHVAEHVASCEECRLEMEALVAARRAVRSLPMLDLPATLAVEPIGSGRRRRPWRVVAAAAAVAVVASAVALGSTEIVPVEDLIAPHVELARVGAAEVTP